MNSKHQESNQLGPVIQSLQVAILMPKNHLPLLSVQSGGQIDPGPEITQNKCGADLIGYPDAVLQTDSFPDMPIQQHAGNHTVKEHTAHTGQPESR